jgi:alkylation response protein AidB-like acyl-CoA dehydrogenase
MGFDLSEEQVSIQKATEEFAKGEFDKETALECEKTHSFPYDILKKACQLGFVGIHYPEKYGGQGYGVLENVLVVEQLCRQDSGLGIALSCDDSCAEMILRYVLTTRERCTFPALRRAMPSRVEPSRSPTMGATSRA